MKKFYILIFLLFYSCSNTIIELNKSEAIFIVDVKLEDYLTIPFIIDTGASDCSIPPYIAYALNRAGKLTEEDVVGEKKYQLANGDIVTSTIVKLDCIEIGGVVLYDITFSIGTTENSPLLLG